MPSFASGKDSETSRKSNGVAWSSDLGSPEAKAMERGLPFARACFRPRLKNFGIGVVKAGRGSQRKEEVAGRINPMLQPIEKGQ